MEKKSSLTSSKEQKEQELVQVGDYYNSSKNYYDKSENMHVAKLYSGDYYVTNKPNHMIVTILGSCVAACIRDPIAKVGGMNHFLLPGSEKDKEDENARFGAYSMEKLINEIMKLGGLKTRLEVKVFGGGNVIDNSAMIGKKNADFVREFLRAEGLRIVSEDLEGTQPRRVHYYPDTGKVMVRKMAKKDDHLIIKAERNYAKSLVQKPADSGGGAEFF